jgi:Na+/melibiose symporter-like transporter
MKTDQQNENISIPPTLSHDSNPRGSFRRVLKNRSFLLLWLAQLLSQVVFNAANYGIIALVTVVTHSTALVGLAIVSFTLPAVPFSLLAGVYVDYLDKRLVLWVSNILRALAMGLMVFVLLVNPHTLIWLFFLAFAISLISQFFTPAEASAIPLLVDQQDLVSALSLFNITLTIAQALGFLILGGLVTSLFPAFDVSLGTIHVHVISFDILFAIVTVIYVICTLLILAIPARDLQQQQRAQPKVSELLGKQAWNIVKEGVKETWTYVGKDRQLLLALLQVSAVSIVLLVIGELAGPFVVNVLRLSVQFLPLIFAPAGVGLVLGGLFMPKLTRWLGINRTIAIGSIATAAGLVLIPVGRFVLERLALPPVGILIFVGGVTFFIGVALDMVNIPAQTKMQQHAPEEERGRIFSFQSMLYNAGSIPVLLFLGVIADMLGVETVLFLLAAGVLVFRAWEYWFSRRL